MMRCVDTQHCVGARFLLSQTLPSKGLAPHAQHVGGIHAQQEGPHPFSSLSLQCMRLAVVIGSCCKLSCASTDCTACISAIADSCSKLLHSTCRLHCHAIAASELSMQRAQPTSQCFFWGSIFDHPLPVCKCSECAESHCYRSLLEHAAARLSLQQHSSPHMLTQPWMQESLGFLAATLERNPCGRPAVLFHHNQRLSAHLSCIFVMAVLYMCFCALPGSIMPLGGLSCHCLSMACVKGCMA